jgi:hypothetical protein
MGGEGGTKGATAFAAANAYGARVYARKYVVSEHNSASRCALTFENDDEFNRITCALSERILRQAGPRIHFAGCRCGRVRSSPCFASVMSSWGFVLLRPTRAVERETPRRRPREETARSKIGSTASNGVPIILHLKRESRRKRMLMKAMYCNPQ